MKLKNKIVRISKFYSIGYSPFLKEYVLAALIPWISYYNRYYRISEEEYSLHKKCIDKLDELAYECYESGIYHPRFICSDRAQENTLMQQSLLRLIIDSDKKLPDYKFKRI